jgi:Fe-S oxidoreductase/nitrate reductase gamma subunit
MLTLIEAIVFIAILILTIYGFFQPLYLRYRLLRAGQPEKGRHQRPFKRLKDVVFSFFFLTCSVKKERVFTGLFHIGILYGSLTFDTVTVYHILEGLNPNIHISKVHLLVADVFSVLVFAAVLYFIIRRWVFRPKYYTYPNLESAIIYALLATVTLTFLLYEGAAIALNPAHSELAFFSKIFAGWLPASASLVKIFWWLHIINVFIFIVYVPRSKYMHMFMGPINIFFQSYQSGGILKPMDIENAEVYGVSKVSDWTWKDLLDGFACMDCGRCEDYCPASQSGKPLSPKQIILKMRDHLLQQRKTLLGGKNPELKPLMENVYSGDEIWTCTSCGACVHVCPVKNEHLSKIIELRQSQALMEAKFPAELNQFFRNMENNSNPWGIGSATRADWAEGLGVKTLAEDAEVDLLFWVGCANAYDDRAKKISSALVKILQAADINFGILGVEENCCGDQARRLGHEYLFQVMAQQNIETLKNYNVNKILVSCPHGYHTLKNEYPLLAKQLGIDDWDIEVIHHSEFIADLIRSGQIAIQSKNNSAITFHDPCYLGRHNHLFTPAREVIAAGGGKIKEMKNGRYHSRCCGAGGGLMWTEEHLGVRINHMRTDDVLQSGAATVCTACPFCLTMLEDGIKDKGKEEAHRVRDIAEIVADCL